MTALTLGDIARAERAAVKARPLPADVDVALRELVRVLAALLASAAVSRQGTTQERPTT